MRNTFIAFLFRFVLQNRCLHVISARGQRLYRFEIVVLPGSSAILSEIRGSEGCGRLILALFADADHDEHDYGHDVREHLKYRYHLHIDLDLEEDVDIIVEHVKRSEKVGADDGKVGLPRCEDDEGDGKPAAVAERTVRPNAVLIVEHEVEPAESCDHSADAGGEVFIFGNVYAGGICGRGVFADGAELKSHTGLFEYTAAHYGYRNGKVHHKAV